MASAAAEDQCTGITLSERSLCRHQINEIQRASSSFPFIKPSLSGQQQDIIKIIKKIEEVCYQKFRKCADGHQKESLSLDKSKYIIKELAAELDRVIELKKFSLMSGKKNNGTEEEQEDYILQWAETLEHMKRKQTEDNETKRRQNLQYERPQTIPTDCRLQTEREKRMKEAKKILSDWFWTLKEMKQNSIRPKKDCRDTLKDLHKQWRRGESSILPVMDWMMWTVLQSDDSEDSVPRQWLKNKQNAVGMHIPNSVWNWIKQSSAVVTLDPNTANPDLCVSEDGKSLRTKTHEESKANPWKGFQRNHIQFDGWICVQAEKGYSTGRHYWEVNVRKKCEWRVGVVKESAIRKGYVTMNTRTGYWNLRLQMRTLIALTEPATKLNLPTPSKIGVYLDIKEKHVSFYDVEKRRHIYTFITDFSGSEKIYPMFGTVETDRELVIL